MSTKMTPHEHQQMLKGQIFGSYNQPAPIQKSEEQKPLGEEGKAAAAEEANAAPDAAASPEEGAKKDEGEGAE